MKTLKRILVLLQVLSSYYARNIFIFIQKYAIPLRYDDPIYKASDYVRRNMFKGFQTGVILYKNDRTFEFIGLNIEYCHEDDNIFIETKNRVLSIDPNACIITSEHIKEWLKLKDYYLALYIRNIYNERSSLLSSYNNLTNYTAIAEKYNEPVDVDKILEGTRYYRMCKVVIIRKGYMQQTVEMVKTISSDIWVHDEKICKINNCLFSQDKIETRSIIGAKAILDGTIDRDHYAESYVIYY